VIFYSYRLVPEEGFQKDVHPDDQAMHLILLKLLRLQRVEAIFDFF
jgi:hypothetical protein